MEKLFIFEFMITQDQVKIIQDVVSRFKPTLIGIFGSYARGEQRPDSDLDILVDFSHRVNLLEIVALQEELSERLGIKVDLVTVKSLNKQVKPYIEEDLIRIA